MNIEDAKIGQLVIYPSTEARRRWNYFAGGGEEDIGIVTSITDDDDIVSEPSIDEPIEVYWHKDKCTLPIDVAAVDLLVDVE